MSNESNGVNDTGQERSDAINKTPPTPSRRLSSNLSQSESNLAFNHHGNHQNHESPESLSSHDSMPKMSPNKKPPSVSPKPRLPRSASQSCSNLSRSDSSSVSDVSTGGDKCSYKSDDLVNDSFQLQFGQSTFFVPHNRNYDSTSPKQINQSHCLKNDTNGQSGSVLHKSQSLPDAPSDPQLSKRSPQPNILNASFNKNSNSVKIRNENKISISENKTNKATVPSESNMKQVCDTVTVNKGSGETNYNELNSSVEIPVSDPIFHRNNGHSYSFDCDVKNKQLEVSPVSDLSIDTSSPSPRSQKPSPRPRPVPKKRLSLSRQSSNASIASVDSGGDKSEHSGADKSDLQVEMEMEQSCDKVRQNVSASSDMNSSCDSVSATPDRKPRPRPARKAPALPEGQKKSPRPVRKAPELPAPNQKSLVEESRKEKDSNSDKLICDCAVDGIRKDSDKVEVSKEVQDGTAMLKDGPVDNERVVKSDVDIKGMGNSVGESSNVDSSENANKNSEIQQAENQSDKDVSENNSDRDVCKDCEELRKNDKQRDNEYVSMMENNSKQEIGNISNPLLDSGDSGNVNVDRASSDNLNKETVKLKPALSRSGAVDWKDDPIVETSSLLDEMEQIITRRMSELGTKSELEKVKSLDSDMPVRPPRHKRNRQRSQSEIRADSDHYEPMTFSDFKGSNTSLNSDSGIIIPPAVSKKQCPPKPKRNKLANRSQSDASGMKQIGLQYRGDIDIDQSGNDSSKDGRGHVARRRNVTVDFCVPANQHALLREIALADHRREQEKAEGWEASSGNVNSNNNSPETKRKARPNRRAPPPPQKNADMKSETVSNDLSNNALTTANKLGDGFEDHEYLEIPSDYLISNSTQNSESSSVIGSHGNEKDKSLPPPDLPPRNSSFTLPVQNPGLSTSPPELPNLTSRGRPLSSMSTSSLMSSYSESGSLSQGSPEQDELSSSDSESEDKDERVSIII